MNTIIRDHFPVNRLPRELQREAAPATHVRLTIEQLPPEVDPGNNKEAVRSPKAPVSRIESLGIDLDSIEPVSLADIRSIAKPIGTTPKQAVRRIRRLRADRGD